MAGAKFYERRRAGRFFAGYATKKWPPFGAAKALFQELRARRENELKLVLVLIVGPNE